MAAQAPTTTQLPPYIDIKKASETSATRYEFRTTSLYLHHSATPDPNPNVHHTIFAPKKPDPNDQNILKPDPIGFGATVANNYAIYDGPDPIANKKVASAQGVHMRTGDSWSTIFNIVFEGDDRIKGSTLQVMGVGIQDGDQLAILSGTGHFTMAQGFIKKKLHRYVSDGTIIKLDIYAVIQPTKIDLITEGPKGGSGGQYREPTGVPYRLEAIIIREDKAICSIEYTYEDQFGLKHTEGPWSGNNSGLYVNTIRLQADEFINEVSGTIGQVNGADVVTSLKFVTNRRTWGPYGKASGNPFTLPEKAGGGSVVGFIARTGEFVNAIGVITRP